MNLSLFVYFHSSNIITNNSLNALRFQQAADDKSLFLFFSTVNNAQSDLN